MVISTFASGRMDAQLSRLVRDSCSWFIEVGDWIYGISDLLAASDVSIFLFKVSSLLSSGTLMTAPLLGLMTTPGAGVAAQVGWVILGWVALGGMV